jgi:hypothetical protein
MMEFKKPYGLSVFATIYKLLTIGSQIPKRLPPKTVTFKPLPPMIVPGDFPLVEENTDPRIPLHFGLGSHLAESYPLGRDPFSYGSIHGPKYAVFRDDLQKFFDQGKEDGKHDVKVCAWELCSGLPKHETDLEDESSPVFWAFNLRPECKSKWAQIDVFICQVLDKHYGPFKRPPVRYFIGESVGY